MSQTPSHPETFSAVQPPTPCDTPRLGSNRTTPIDAFAAHVAILDERGFILAVNEAWRKFAELNDLAWHSFGIGANYLGVCESASGECREQAITVARAIREVASAQRDEFCMTYDCSSPQEERTFQCRISRFQDAGQIRLMVCHENVSQAVEQRRLFRERLDSLARNQRLGALGEMAAMLAHELNQPLAAIANYAAGTRRRLSERPDAGPLIEGIESIEEEIKRAASIVRRVREFAKPQAMGMSPLTVASVIESTMSLCRPMFHASKVRFIADLPTDPLCLLGDPVQLGQVLVNLFRNATEAMEQTPVHEREIRMISRLEREGAFNRIAIMVEDNGPPIDREVAERIFSPFFTTKSGGMGIGLALCRSIIENHGGHINAVRLPQRGLRVRIILPHDDEAAREHAEHQSASTEKSRHAA